MIQRFLVIGLGVFAASVLGVSVASAQFASCNYDYGLNAAAPAGYGSVTNFFFGGMELTIDCNNHQVDVGTGDALEYVYKTAYIYTNGGWQAVPLTSSSPLLVDTWYTGRASGSIASVDLTAKTYVVGYTCSYANSTWKCGCSDLVCATSNWQLQSVVGVQAMSNNGGSM